MMEKHVEHTSGFVMTKTQLWLVFVACSGGGHHLINFDPHWESSGIVYRWFCWSGPGKLY